VLAQDQLRAVQEIKQWYRGNKAFHILNGAAGVGKSFVVDSILEELPKDKVVLLAPTHKALRQLKEKCHHPYEFRTVANALGIRPIDEGKDLKFEQISLPSFWETIDFVVCDESGMIDDSHIDIFKTLGVKILYVGHKSQLPPIRENRSIFDKCISPVFEKGYDESHLWIPKRNIGELWEFCNLLEQRIYDDSVKVPTTFDLSQRDFNDFFSSTESREDFLSGNLKVALWTNEGLDKVNLKVRKLLWGNEAKFKYLPGDRVILTNNIISLNFLEYLTDTLILRAVKDAVDVYNSTDGVVEDVSEVTIRLNKALVFQCYKLKLKTFEGTTFVYELVYKHDYKRIADYYEHKAWGMSSKQSKDKAYKERALLLKFFAQVKHFYGSTCHRLQGSSIEKVLVIGSDVNKNSNRVERAKCMYVGASRASKELMVYRGLI